MALCTICSQDLSNPNLKKDRIKSPFLGLRKFKEDNFVTDIDDLIVGEIILVPSGRKAEVTKLIESVVYKNSGIQATDPFDRVDLTYLDKKQRVSLQPHLLRKIY
jgi:hypothetical protein